MCGIAFIIGANKSLKLEFVSRANILQSHRGPDGEGTYFDDLVGMGHRRLAIQDLSNAGHQPMLTNDSRYVLIFNGEIYNHLELREKYFPDFNFNGHSDTETLLHLLIKFKENTSEMLNGMWAFAFYDKFEKKILISRDRYGQKPLYWRRFMNDTIGFASEIKPLLMPGERPIANKKMVAEYLATGNYEHLIDQTFFKDVRQLAPGHFANINVIDGVFEPKRFWRFPTLPDKEKVPLNNEKIEEFKELFKSSVSYRLLSDVPVGASLSGGLDSSAVVAQMLELRMGKPFEVFTARSNNSAFDESNYVLELLEKNKNYLKANWFASSLIDLEQKTNKIIYYQEEPFGDSSILAHWELQRIAKEKGIPVVLGGQGADEILYGYPFMYKTLIAYWSAKGNIIKAFNEAGNMKLTNNDKLRTGLGIISSGIERKLREKSRERRGGWLSSDFKNELKISSLKSSSTSLNSTWLETVEQTAIPHLVHYDDRNTMSHSVEGRMPFLDHRLADFISVIRTTDLYKNGYQKWPLREIMRDMLPQNLLERRDKIGFYTPLEYLLNNKSVNEKINTYLDSVENVEIDAKKLSNNTKSLHRWRIFCLISWKEQFNISNFD